MELSQRNPHHRRLVKEPEDQINDDKRSSLLVTATFINGNVPFKQEERGDPEPAPCEGDAWALTTEAIATVKICPICGSPLTAINDEQSISLSGVPTSSF